MADEAQPGPSGLTPSPSKASPKKKKKSPKKRKTESLKKKNIKRSKIGNVTSTEKRWICIYCQKKCSENNYRDHVSRHEDEKKYQCDFCEKKFKTKRNVKKHIKTSHSKSIPCGICNKIFTSQTLFNKHICLQQQEYICDYCNRVFIMKRYLRRHIQTIHLEKKVHECNNCEKKFRHPYQLKRHKKTHRKKELSLCDKCGAQYLMMGFLNKHIKEKHNDNPSANEQRGEHFSRDDQNSKESGQSDSSDNAKSKLSDSDINAMMDEALQEEEEKLIEDFQEFNFYDCDSCSKIFTEKEDLEEHKNGHTESSNI